MESELSPDRGTYKFDAVAVEALAAGIGLGAPVAKKEPPPRTEVQEPTEEERTVSAVLQPRSGHLRSVAAYGLDLFIIAVSLFTSTGAAYFATIDEIPLPADLLFTLASKFEPHQIVIGISSLILGYFSLFKIMAGLTLGEVLVGIGRK